MTTEKLSKLKKPPYAHNFVRQIGNDKSTTLKRIMSFVDGYIPYSYRAATPIILDRLRLKIDKRTALVAAANSKPANSRKIVSEYIEAFIDYDEEIGLSNQPNFLDDVSPYRASHDIVVPVKPLAILSNKHGLCPLFSFGWSTFSLNEFQIRLMMTLIEEAVFTLEDYKSSPGHFVCFPKEGQENGTACRSPMVWQRGDYNLLSFMELVEVFSNYVEAVEDARQLIMSRPEIPKEINDVDRKDDFGMDDLFGDRP